MSRGTIPLSAAWQEKYPLRMEKRPEKIATVTYKVETGCGKMYIRITHKDGKPFEIFPELGKAGGCVFHWTEAVGKCTSIMLRIGVDPAMLVFFLQDLQCGRPHGMIGKRVLSCTDAIARTLEKFLSEHCNRTLHEKEMKNSYWET